MTIVILGAGETAAATARQLAAARVASRLVMVDQAATVAAGKALDIAQAAPVDRYDAVLAGTDDETAIVGASVVVVADRADAAGEWAGEDGLALVQRVARLNESAPIVCAGTRQRAVIDRAVREGGLPRSRVFGTAPEALRGAICSLVALEAECGPAEIALLVVGRPPQEIIVPWDAVSLGGRAALDVLPPPVLARLETRLPHLWPQGPYALGSAAARVIATMVHRLPRTHILDVALTREESPEGRPAMLPARVGPPGILRVEPPPLSARDRVRLQSALAR